MKQKFASLITILVFLFSIGCKKENMISHDLIAEGCIPQKVVVDEPILGGYEDNYVYDNDKLIRYGNNSIEYDNGLVSKITLGPSRYEEYFYNDQFQVNKSLQFREDDPSEGFMLVDEKEYKYENDRIIEIIDIDDNETDLISYYPNSNNIDSIKTINGDSEIIEILVFQYDEFNHPQKNLLIPRFNYFWWIERGFENNVTQRKRIKLQNQGETLIWNYDFVYNDFDYPTEIVTTKVNSNYTSKMVITYTNCE